MAIYSDLLIDQGSYFSSIVPVNSQKIFDFDLTEYTGRGKIKKSYHSQSWIDFDVSITNPSSGNIEISLDSDVTSAMNPGRYVFDVEIVETSTGKVTRVQEGQLEVTPGVTSPTDISNGGTILNTSLTFLVQPTNVRTGNARALLFNKDNTQKAISTQAGTESQPTVERLVIAGGDGFDTGEGGDIYLWAGRSGDDGGSGGDIKVDAGDSYNSVGGTVKIRGGNGYDGTSPGASHGGFVFIEAGNSWNGGNGADLTLTAGSSYNVPGGTDGKVLISTGKGSNNWNFNADGSLTTSGDIEITDKTKGIIMTSPNNTRYRVTIADNGELVSTPL